MKDQEIRKVYNSQDDMDSFGAKKLENMPVQPNQNEGNNPYEDNKRYQKLEIDSARKDSITIEFEGHLPSDIDPKYVLAFVFIQFFINLFINIDMGILPAGSTVIKEELGIENAKFGLLGSVVYLGQTVGAALSSVVLQYCNPKKVLGTCLFFNVVSLIVFTVTENFTILMICRMCTGLFQIIFAIFMPVWADVYGNEVQKSRWITYLIVSNPLGVVMGYGLCAGFL